MFDTETDLGHGLIGADEIGGAEDFEESPVGSYADAQYDFIKKDLSSVDRQKTPWVIALGHRPWYTAGADGDQYWNGQAAFEQLFIDNGVDVVLHGHVHNVQRSYPIANNVTDPNGYDDPKAPMYIVNGAGEWWRCGISSFAELTESPQLATLTASTRSSTLSRSGPPLPTTPSTRTRR